MQERSHCPEFLGQGTLVLVTLTLLDDPTAARWLMASDTPWQQLVCFGPAEFPAYARLRFLPDPSYEGQRENDVHVAEGAESETSQLRAVLATLARHTRTPKECYFCLWDGWGWSPDNAGALSRNQESGSGRPEQHLSDTAPIVEPPGRPGLPALYVDDGAPLLDQFGSARPAPYPVSAASVPRWPKVELPHRAYFLFRGTLADFGDWVLAESGAAYWAPHLPDPALIWPADHAWCVARDVDPHWAGIGGGLAAVGEVLADPHLDVVPADPRQNQPAYR